MMLLPGISHALNENTADIPLTGDLKNMNVVVNPGGTGCPAGQYWDIGRGRCTTEVQLRTVNVSESCSCSCPSGTTGSCTMRHDGSYPVFGWRLPTAGNELISRYGSTSWGACYSTSNNCVANPDGGGDTGGGGGTAPPPGTSFIIDAFICNSGHPDYNSGPLGASDKGKIIATYRQFNYGQRCPELSGFVYWQNSWLNWANEYMAKFPGTSMAIALASTWVTPTQSAMNQAATENGERDSSYAGVLNAACSAYALRKYGVSVSATYLLGTGSSCIVN